MKAIEKIKLLKEHAELVQSIPAMKAVQRIKSLKRLSEIVVALGGVVETVKDEFEQYEIKGEDIYLTKNGKWVKLLMTEKQWRDTPSEYKGILNGVRSVLHLSQHGSTALIDVEIISRSEYAKIMNSKQKNAVPASTNEPTQPYSSDNPFKGNDSILADRYEKRANALTQSLLNELIAKAEKAGYVVNPTVIDSPHMGTFIASKQISDRMSYIIGEFKNHSSDQAKRNADDFKVTFLQGEPNKLKHADPENSKDMPKYTSDISQAIEWGDEWLNNAVQSLNEPQSTEPTQENEPMNEQENPQPIEQGELYKIYQLTQDDTVFNQDDMDKKAEHNIQLVQSNVQKYLPYNATGKTYKHLCQDILDLEGNIEALKDGVDYPRDFLQNILPEYQTEISTKWDNLINQLHEALKAVNAHRQKQPEYKMMNEIYKTQLKLKRGTTLEQVNNEIAFINILLSDPKSYLLDKRLKGIENMQKALEVRKDFQQKHGVISNTSANFNQNYTQSDIDYLQSIIDKAIDLETVDMDKMIEIGEKDEHDPMYEQALQIVSDYLDEMSK